MPGTMAVAGNAIAGVEVKSNGGRRGRSPPLIRRRVHDQPVERLRHLDLARTAARSASLRSAVELFLFLGEGGPTTAVHASST